jgi:L-fuconolactonase
MLITDSGLHIWRAPTPERLWMPGRTAHLPEPISYENLRERTRQAGVHRAILIPPSWEGDSSEYSLEAAAKYPTFLR